ncbi:HEAT repeat domain-containing protein, partial [bacterium]|nr:HEAT repeat domain-containing protein [bacterium]
AAAALGRLGETDQEVINALTALLNDRFQSVRWNAAYALGNLGNPNQQTIKALIGLLKDRDSSVKYVAAEALGKFGNTDQQIIDGLINALKHEDYILFKENAAWAIMKLLFLRGNSLKDLKYQLAKERKLSLFPSISKNNVISFILENINEKNWQEVFDAPNAVKFVVKEFLDENSPDRIYYVFPFFNIEKLRLPIAMELVKELANPMTDERTKLVIFQLLMRVELVDEQGQPLK